MKKLLALILVGAIVLSGCARSKQPAPNNPDQQPPTSPPTTETEKQPETNPPGEILGVYIGQIDNNSIEIKVNNKDTAFRFNDQTRQTFENLNPEEGQMVKIQYQKNSDNQLILQKIETIPNPGVPLNADSKAASGIYVGKIDNNEVEIKVDSQPTPFWIAQELKTGTTLGALKEGDQIKFQYYIDGNGRKVIVTFEKQ